MCNPETTSRGIYVGEVLANDKLCLEHYRLRLKFPSFPATRPGQFVQIQCRSLTEQTGVHEVDWPEGELPQLGQAELTGSETLLRRPFSLAGRDEVADGVVLTVIYRIVGAGTGWLATAEPGYRLSVLGPLGNGFTIRPDKPLVVVVGGGVGIPPMIYIANQLRREGKQVVAFNGCRERDLLPLTLEGAEVCTDGRPTLCCEEFNRIDTPSVIATDDGSLGYSGFVSNALRAWLMDTKPWPEDVVCYSCGPEPLMKAVADLCFEHGVECQLALERKMACGMGTCQSCVVKVRDDSDAGWGYKLCCKDGPVFDARDLLW